MHTNQHLETYDKNNILSQQNAHCLADGSIDYTFYAKRARTHRGIAFRHAVRSVNGLIRHIIALIVPTRPKPQDVRLPEVELVLTRPAGRSGNKRNEFSKKTGKRYSKAA